MIGNYVIKYTYRQEERAEEHGAFVNLVEGLYQLENFDGGFAYEITDSVTDSVLFYRAIVDETEEPKWIDLAGRVVDFEQVRERIRESVSQGVWSDSRSRLGE